MAAVCHADPHENRNIDAIQRRLMGRALRQVTRDSGGGRPRVLDYGCGSGRWASQFEQLEYTYTGVDIAEEMVRLARITYPPGNFAVVMNGALPWADGTFFLVCSIAVLHHNPPDEQTRIVGELLRVLRGDGWLILFESVGEPDPRNPVEFARPRAEWIDLLERRGMACTWWEGARYFLLRTLLERLLGVSGAEARSAGWRATWGRWALRAGARVDPYLGALLPERFQQRAVMVFHHVTADRETTGSRP